MRSTLGRFIFWEFPRASWQYDVMVGLILAFILFRLEPRLREIEASINRINRSLLIALVALPQAKESEKEQARNILKEIEKKGGEE